MKLGEGSLPKNKQREHQNHDMNQKANAHQTTSIQRLQLQTSQKFSVLRNSSRKRHQRNRQNQHQQKRNVLPGNAKSEK